jgi:hypothetical protein
MIGWCSIGLFRCGTPGLKLPKSRSDNDVGRLLSAHFLFEEALMGDPTTKAQILNLIEAEHQALQAVLAPLSESQMVEPEAEEKLSVKDILVHITDWEQRMMRWIEVSLQGKTPERPAPGMTWDDLDRLNEQTYLGNKDRSLGEVRSDFVAWYQKSLRTIEALSEADLFDAHRFAWREGEALWHMVEANTWVHYREHRESISRWLAEQT